MWHGWGPWPFFGFLWFLLLCFFVFAVARWVFWGRRWNGCGGVHAARHEAEAILRQRFARGEIDEQEYRQRLDTLRH